MDTVRDLARREEMSARMQVQRSDVRTLLYVLPSSLAEVSRVYWLTGGSLKYKTLQAVTDHTAEFGFKDLRVVDISDALRAFWRAESSLCIRALANAYDTTTEVDILAIEPAYLTNTQPTVNANQ